MSALDAMVLRAMGAILRGDPAWRVKYAAYIRGPRWRALRARMDLFCRSCGSTERIQVHHRTYDRLGVELPGDLVPLCASCHEQVHSFHRSTPLSLADATDRMLRSPPHREPPREVPDFVPANQRTAVRLPDGRLLTTRSWRDEARSVRGIFNAWGDD